MTAPAPFTVYGIFTIGHDYYDQEELHSLYATEQDATDRADALRLEESEDAYEPTLYAEVTVRALNVR